MKGRMSINEEKVGRCNLRKRKKVNKSKGETMKEPGKFSRERVGRHVVFSAVRILPDFRK